MLISLNVKTPFILYIIFYIGSWTSKNQHVGFRVGCLRTARIDPSRRGGMDEPLEQNGSWGKYNLQTNSENL